MDDGFEAYLSADDVSFGPADAALLRAIAEHGSVSGAASTLGRSRSRSLARLEALEDAYGPLVERRRGGAGGGGSRLTDGARDLLERFDRLWAALSGTAGVEETVMRGVVTRREGELGLVETDAGTVRALVVAARTPDDAANVDAGTPVQVSVPADAVTLHTPADAPRAGATSARNRFEGRVADVDRGEAVVRVAVDASDAGMSGTEDADANASGVGGVTVRLLALVTTESADRLDLSPDDGVVASFKATATRATPVER